MKSHIGLFREILRRLDVCAILIFASPLLFWRKYPLPLPIAFCLSASFILHRKPPALFRPCSFIILTDLMVVSLLQIRVPLWRGFNTVCVPGLDPGSSVYYCGERRLIKTAGVVEYAGEFGRCRACGWLCLGLYVLRRI